MSLTNMKIGTRLWLGFGLMLALLAVSVLAALFRLEQTQSGTQSAAEYARRASMADTWLNKTQLNANRTLALAKASAGRAEMEEYFAPMLKQTSAEISELQQALTAAIQDDKGRALLADIGEKRKAYMETRGKLFEQLKAGDQAAADALVKDKLLPAVDTYLAAMGALKAHEEAMVREQSEAVKSDIAATQVVFIVLMLVSLAAGVTGALQITRSVTRPLQRAVDAANVIAANDLSHPIESTRRDELGELLRALGGMQAALRTMVSQVRASTENISTASTQIAVGNQDLSARTEQTASNLQETSSSLSQLTQAVHQSSDSARQANQLAGSAAEIAARGGQVVSQVISTMDEINASSKKISDIIGVIDGIAFQTNILALNAAVEAARAGEQGRGFAVVAGEVRTLAQRSAQAAKEIKGLIGASVDKVESGSKLVADAGQTMQEIVGSVQRVTDIIGEITAASSEQSDGIGQVNAAVTQLDQMTQQNAALVEQSAAAAESLKQQAHSLSAVVSNFRLDGHGSARVDEPRPAVPPSRPATAAPSKPTPVASAKPMPAPKPAPKPAAEPMPAQQATPSPASRAAAMPAPIAVPAASAPKSDDDWETF